MKYLFLFLIFFTSCKENYSQQNKTKSQRKVSFYDLVFDELKNIDTSKYYITYEIKNNYHITNEIYQSIKNIELLNSTEIINLKNSIFFKPFDIKLSKRNKEIIRLSKNDNLKKVELNHLFSYPYLIGENKVLIALSVKYRHQSSKEVKGGSDRIILFTKNKEGTWSIIKNIGLLEI